MAAMPPSITSSIGTSIERLTAQAARRNPLRARNPAMARPAKPTSIIAHVEGSGMVAAARRNRTVGSKPNQLD
jgi:hypothetical protein